VPWFAFVATSSDHYRKPSEHMLHLFASQYLKKAIDMENVCALFIS
jgi:hypothetical protein